MNNFKTKYVALLAAMIVMALALAGCGGFGSKKPVTPGILDNLVQSEKYENIYFVTGSGINWDGDGVWYTYGSLNKFGDMYLLSNTDYGEYSGGYESGEEDPEDGYYDDYGDDMGNFDEVIYSFAVYDPISNSVPARLAIEGSGMDTYFVSSDKLWFLSYYDSTLTCYSSRLLQVGSFNLIEFFGTEEFDAEIYTLRGNEGEYFYANSKSGDRLHQFCLGEDGELIHKEIELPMVSAHLCSAIVNGRVLVIGGKNSSTLRNCLCFYNVDYDYVDLTLEHVSNYNGYNASYGAEGFADRDWSMENGWMYNYMVEAEGSFDVRTEYFYGAESGSCYVLDDSSMLFTNYNWDEDDNCTVTYALTDSQGKLLASLDYEQGFWGNEDYSWLSSEPITYGDDYLMFLRGSNGADCDIVVWKVRDSASQSSENNQSGQNETDERPQYIHFLSEEELQKEKEYSEIDLYDQAAVTGPMRAARQMADEFEAKYGVRMFVGLQVPGYIGGYNIDVCEDSATVCDAIEKLDNIFSKYPDGFFDQLVVGDNKDFCIFISDEITAEANDGHLSKAGAFVTTESNHVKLVIDIDEIFITNYTINHEISHAIDNRLSEVCLYTDEDIYNRADEVFAEINPQGFSYMNSYYGYWNKWNWTYYNYFRDSYALTYLKEDKAQVFGEACQMVINEADTSYFYLKDDGSPSPMLAKLRYACECIRKCFDTTGWPEETMWEKIANLNFDY